MAKLFELGLVFKFKSNAKEELVQTSKEAKNAAQSFDSAEKSAKRLSGISFKGLEAKAKGLKKWADGISLEMQAFSQVRTLGADITAFGGRIAGSLERPVGAMARLESGMVSLKSVMLDANGAVKGSFNGLSEAVIKTANKLPATADEMYQAAAGAVARGMDAEALAKGGLEDSAKFAVGVLGNDYNRALEIANLISQSWNVGSDKLAGDFGVYDMLTRAKSMGVNVEDMATMISKTGASAAALGSTGYEALTERMPYLVMLKKQLAGMSAEVLSTGLSQLEARVMDKNAVNKAAAAAGVQLQFTNREGKYLGFENLVEQLGKLNGLSDEKRSAAIKELFGSSANMSALVSTLMNDKTGGVQGAAEITARMKEQASLDKIVSTQLGTFSAQWNAFTGTLDTSMGKIGMNFNPVLTDLAGLATSAAEKLGDFGEKFPGLTKAIGYTTLGVGGLTMAAGKGLEIAGQLGMALPLLEKLGPQLKKLPGGLLKGAKAMGSFAAANWQLLLIGAGVASLVYVFSQLSDVTTEAGRDLRVLTSGFDGFKAVIGKVGGFLRYIFNGFEIDEESAAASLRVDELAANDRNLQAEIKRQQIINQGGDHIEANFTINNNGGNMTEQEIRKIATNTVSDLQQRAQLNSERSYGRKRW